MCTILGLNYFILFTLLYQLWISFRDCLSCNSVWFPCNFLFLMWLSLSMLPLIFGPLFYGSWITIIPWQNLSNFMYKVVIGIEECQAVVLMLCRISFNLSGRVEEVGFHVSSLFLVTNRQHMPVCAKMNSS